MKCWEEGRPQSHHLLMRVKLNMIIFLVPSKEHRPLLHVEHRSGDRFCWSKQADSFTVLLSK